MKYNNANSRLRIIETEYGMAKVSKTKNIAYSVVLTMINGTIVIKGGLGALPLGMCLMGLVALPSLDAHSRQLRMNRLQSEKERLQGILSRGNTSIEPTRNTKRLKFVKEHTYTGRYDI